mgnify:CR=1 FL=1
MTQLIPIFIDGKRWIQLGQLPAKQAIRFKNWLPKNRIKNLRIGGMEVKDCVDFASYDYWFRNYKISSSDSLTSDF